MARDNDYRDDVTGRRIDLEATPLVVRISVSLAPGAPADVRLEDLSPFLQALVAQAPARLEIAAATFDRCFVTDMTTLSAAFQQRSRKVAKQSRVVLRRRASEDHD